MRETLTILLAAAVWALPANAQETGNGNSFPRNAVYGEFGGAGVGGSFNYERLLNDRIALRAGYAVFAFTFFEQIQSQGLLVGALHLIPVSTWAADRGGTIELGITAGHIRTTTSHWFSDRVDESSSVTIALQASYAYRPVTGGLFFRLGIAPLMSFTTEGSRGIPYFSISVGGVF